MKPKLKPDLDLEAIQSDMIETVCSNYINGVSVRSLAKQMDMSPMKVRKILITGNAYSTDLSIEIGELWRDGKTVPEIAKLLSMTTANVNSYLPYERVVYNMEERSVEADRQARYRQRKKGIIPPAPERPSVPTNAVERVRDKTMLFIIGPKLRKLLPAGLLDNTSDPFARHLHFEDPFNPPDPDKYIWCAEVTTSGRGKGKKQGIVLESANCGFVVVAPFVAEVVPVVREGERKNALNDYCDAVAAPFAVDDIPLTTTVAEGERQKAMNDYRDTLVKDLLSTIRKGLLTFHFPENRVADYIDVIGRVELIKGRLSLPMTRVQELVSDFKWEKGEDPSDRFRVQSNFCDRKFGYNSMYRQVYEATSGMLELNQEEHAAWIQALWKPVLEE